MIDRGHSEKASAVARSPVPVTRRATVAAFLGGLLLRSGGRTAQARDRQQASETSTDTLGLPAPSIDQAPAVHSSRLVTRLTRYGFKGNGSALDTAAWRDAIAEAVERGLNEIVVPAGRSMVDGDLLAEVGGRLPTGLTFRGEGRSLDSEYVNSSSLIYTGQDVCWNIRYPTGGPLNSGRWIWQDLSFRAMHVVGTMFSFNDPLSSRPSDDDPYQFLMRIAFQRCFAHGASAFGRDFRAQTGDFLRAAKVFHLDIDALTTVMGWRRGVWLRGCDNCRIDARFASNTRAVMNEMADGVFGNENRIQPAMIAGLPSASGSSEPSYGVWDAGRNTTIGGALLFEAQGAIAHLYLNGHRTTVLKPVFGTGARLFHLGPDATGVTMVSPDAPVARAEWAPLIDRPATPAFGAAQSDHRMRIEDAPLATQLILLAADDRHGRVQVVNSPVHGMGFPAPDEPGTATTRGYLVPVACTGGNFWGDGGIGGRPIEGIVPDAQATGGQAIKLSREKGSGFGLSLAIGRRIMPARYTVSIRNRLSGPVTTGELLFIATRNGAFLQHLPLAKTTAYERPASALLDLTGFAPGDVLALQLFNNGTGLNVWVDYVVVAPVPD